MTEIGMALTNPIEEAYRESGAVGKPFPGVQARIVGIISGYVKYRYDISLSKLQLFYR